LEQVTKRILHRSVFTALKNDDLGRIRRMEPTRAIMDNHANDVLIALTGAVGNVS
jgi:hypothetical protein